MLGFQAEPAMHGVIFAPLAGEGAIERITGIKLEPGFGGVDRQDSSALGFKDLRGQ